MSLNIIARALLVVSLASALGASASGSQKPLRWLLNGPALRTFAADGNARAFFRDSRPFVLQRRDAAVEVPGAWNALSIRSFTSYKAMAAAFERRSLGTNVGGVMYDAESWRFTPPDEQRNVLHFMELGSRLAHAHGLLFLAAPAVNLVAPLGAKPEEPRYDAYLRLRIAGESARYADVLIIQAQGSERVVDKFRAFVAASASQARAVNPKVTVLAGISTNPNGQRVSASSILNAIRATRREVDGYWFNVPAPGPYCPRCSEFRPDVALDVINRLAK